MNTNTYPTNDQSSLVRTDHHHNMGGEQYRQEMRAALQELRQRLGEGHKVTAGPAPSSTEWNQKKIVPEAPWFLRHFYFLCRILNADKWRKTYGQHFLCRRLRGGIHVDLIYLIIAAIFFLLSGWLISALERL